MKLVLKAMYLFHKNNKILGFHRDIEITYKKHGTNFIQISSDFIYSFQLLLSLYVFHRQAFAILEDFSLGIRKNSCTRGILNTSSIKISSNFHHKFSPKIFSEIQIFRPETPAMNHISGKFSRGLI